MTSVRLSVIEFIGYREWTEQLGDDREWLIQIIQSEVYALAQRMAAEVGAHVLPMRYDYMMLLSSNVDKESLGKVLEVITENSQVPVRMATACGSTPLEAEAKAWSILSNVEPRGMYHSQCSREMAVVVHIDIDNITGMTRRMGATRTYYIVVDLLNRISRKAEKYGSIVQYLGGDNILAVLPPDNYEAIVSDLININDMSIDVNLKAGVGVAPTARQALSLAAKALHKIRSGAKEKIIYEIYGLM